MTKDEAKTLLDEVIFEAKEIIQTKDNVWSGDLEAEIFLMDKLFEKLCHKYECKNYGSNIEGFINDLQNVAKLSDMKIGTVDAMFYLKKRQWRVESDPTAVTGNQLYITYSDYMGVDGITLSHDNMISPEALVMLDRMTWEIWNKLAEICPLLIDGAKRSGNYDEEDMSEYYNLPRVYEFSKLIPLNQDFPVRECKKCSFAIFNKPDEVEKMFGTWGLGPKPFCYFVTKRVVYDWNYIDRSCPAKSYLPDWTLYESNIMNKPTDTFTGVKNRRFAKGDLVWCVDLENDSKMRLGIVYDVPYTSREYQNRLMELRKHFGSDYELKLDNDNFGGAYTVLLLNDKDCTGYHAYYDTPYVFPIKEKVPKDIHDKLIKLLEEMD